MATDAHLWKDGFAGNNADHTPRTRGAEQEGALTSTIGEILIAKLVQDGVQLPLDEGYATTADVYQTTGQIPIVSVSELFAANNGSDGFIVR